MATWGIVTAGRKRVGSSRVKDLVTVVDYALLKGELNYLQHGKKQNQTPYLFA